MAAHGLYAQVLHEMLIQDWNGKIDLFTASPFENAWFRLRAGNQIVEATKSGKKITRIDPVADH